MDKNIKIPEILFIKFHNYIKIYLNGLRILKKLEWNNSKSGHLQIRNIKANKITKNLN